MSDPTRIALIGANGHGLWHRRELARRPELDLVALCDVAPIVDADGAPVPTAAELFTDHRRLLDRARPDVVIICTPPHTHLDLAADALRSGADVLLEKPPVESLAEHRALLAVVTATGRALQIGFQALGSAALVELLDAVRGGALGTITGVAAIASWQRPDAYYDRAPWAGRRRVGDRVVIDGALVNPLAHAVMQSLAVAEVAGGQVAGGQIESGTIELERYRTRDIEVEDTAFLRFRSAAGSPVVVAVTLCGEDFIPGEIIVQGTAGRAVLEYPTDRLALPGDESLRVVAGRASLLDNLLAHRRDPATPLIVPLARTESFTALVESIVAAPAPTPLFAPVVAATDEGPQRRHTILGINEVLRTTARTLALPHEQGVAWTIAAHRIGTLAG